MILFAVLIAVGVGIGLGYLLFGIDDNKKFTTMQVRKMFDELYKEIEHGEKEHRIWLWDKINQFCERKGLR